MDLNLKYKSFEQAAFFMSRALKNPSKVGAIVPSSKFLGKELIKQVKNRSGYILDIGAGTGLFVNELIKSGFSAEKIIALEIDKKLCIYLKRRFKKTTIIEGDASQLSFLLPKKIIGNISTIITGLPYSLISMEKKKRIFEEKIKILQEDGEILGFSYFYTVFRLPKFDNLTKKIIGFTIRNFPPAFIYQYKNKF